MIQHQLKSVCNFQMIYHPMSFMFDRLYFPPLMWSLFHSNLSQHCCDYHGPDSQFVPHYNQQNKGHHSLLEYHYVCWLIHDILGVTVITLHWSSTWSTDMNSCLQVVPLVSSGKVEHSIQCPIGEDLTKFTKSRSSLTLDCLERVTLTGNCLFVCFFCAFLSYSPWW